MNPFLYSNKYIIPVTLYGAIRKMLIVKDAEYSTWNRKTKATVEIPMLITDKIVLVAASALGSIYVWPYYLYNDINTLQLYLKTRDMSTEDATIYINNYKEYPFGKSLLDYFIM